MRSSGVSSAGGLVGRDRSVVEPPVAPPHRDRSAVALDLVLADCVMGQVQVAAVLEGDRTAADSRRIAAQQAVGHCQIGVGYADARSSPSAGANLAVDNSQLASGCSIRMTRTSESPLIVIPFGSEVMWEERGRM